MKNPVLLYHKIDLPTADVKIRGAFTAPHRFAKQIAYLKRQGFEFFSTSELAEFYLDNDFFPEKAICITFDDGWKDNYTNAFPVLKQFGVRATIFLVPFCVGRITDQVTADGEGVREHLSEENIREMSEFGIEFGSHTMNHKLFDRITEDEIVAEVSDSKNYIENLLQKQCLSFAYPAGFFTPFAKSAIKKAGYTSAYTTVYGSDEAIDMFELNRTEILRRDKFPFRFAGKVRSLI